MAEPNSVIIEASNPGVKEVTKQWGVYEDGALAYKLQEEENVNHFSGNISRRRTVRDDREVAKDVAKDVAIEAFREEHEMAMRNMQMEEEDREQARQMQMELIKEEQEKAKREQEEDQERARLLQLQMIREEQESEDTDEMLARRLQQEEKMKLDAERQKLIEARQMKRDEQLARRLSQQEGLGKQPPLPQKQHSGKRREKSNHVEDTNHNLSGSQVGAVGGGAHQPLTVALGNSQDSDEESDAVAKVRHDEMIARKLQHDEKQRSRPRTLSEEQQRQLAHDEKIARKMQHEEVMLAKKKTYNRYKQRVSDEIADPAPMVHVSKEKKVPVLAEAKEGNGITLTDVTRPASAEVDLNVDESTNGGANILAAIDPTYNPNASGNVILTKRTPIGDAAPPPEPTPNRIPGVTPPDNFIPVQGTRRSSTKKEEKEKKRGSIFSKLSKKK